MGQRTQSLKLGKIDLSGDRNEHSTATAGLVAEFVDFLGCDICKKSKKWRRSDDQFLGSYLNTVMQECTCVFEGVAHSGIHTALGD